MGEAFCPRLPQASRSLASRLPKEAVAIFALCRRLIDFDF
jgi:hypothetical protein